MNRRSVLCGLSAGCLALPISAMPGRAEIMPRPDTVSFPSLDGRTKLVGYLFAPARRPPGPVPAMVLLHGRAGPYSSLANGRYDATTLSKRHTMWASFWARQGCFALLVDSFGPRGLPAGFPAGSHAQRPAEINEVTVRPRDAYGGLQYLASRESEIDPHRIGLQGWSNGGSATLAAMATGALRDVGLSAADGFRAALAFYPGCGLDNRFRDGYAPYAPVRILIGTADEEVSPRSCQVLVEGSRSTGNDIAITVYPNATHDFDDPGKKRQRVVANVAAFKDAVSKATAFMGQYLRT